MISKSPDRGSFSRESHIKSATEKGEEPKQDYLDLLKTWDEQTAEREQDPEWQKNNMEYDLRSTDWILEKARSSDVYAQNLYAAMCNMRWIRREMWPLLKEEYWSCSWRSAGGIVANMQQKGDYIDWYCSGINYTTDMEDEAYNALTKEQQEQYLITKQYVPEGTITDEIETDLNKLGWIPSPWPDE
jgi:hypothetical protein